MASMSLTIGPLLFNWPADKWRDFYARVADEAPVERVCVGEVVCSKRLPFIVDEFAGTVERLQRGGKSVIMSALALPTLARERDIVDELSVFDGVMVEANDVSQLPKLAGRAFAVGPFVNVYNEGTLGFLQAYGAVRACLPPELPLSAVSALAAAATGVALEVWGFGRVPLAISARCYHARIHKLAKDSCQFVCAADADGLGVDTLDGEQFLAVNGVQTMSHACASLIGDLDALAGAGIASLRLSPQSGDMVAVAKAFRDVLEGRCDPEEGQHRLSAEVPFAAFTNGFLRGQPGWRWLPAAAE